MIFYGIVLLIVGCLGLFAPDLLFEMMNTLYNEAEGEPNKFWMVSHRVGGAISILVGLGLVIWHFWDFIARG